MKLKKFFNKFQLTSIKLNSKFAEVEIEFSNHDKECAWYLYVELITRITTQPLPNQVGDESTALESVHSIFKSTRDILKEKGRKAVEFTKISIIVLNQVIRPFTAKWHKKLLCNAFNKHKECIEFRKDLSSLQIKLRNYSKMLAAIAEVEDLTTL